MTLLFQNLYELSQLRFVVPAGSAKRISPHISNLVGFAMILLSVLTSGREARAELRAEPSHLNLGNQRQNQTIESEINLNNSGSHPVVIIAAHADCSCTVATPTKTTVEPGGTTTLKTSVETRNFEGPIHRGIVIQTSEGTIDVNIDLVVARFEHWIVSPSGLSLYCTDSDLSKTHVGLKFTGKGIVKIVNITSTPSLLDCTATTVDENNFEIGFVKRTNAILSSGKVRVVVETTDSADATIPFEITFADRSRFASPQTDAGPNKRNSEQSTVRLRAIPSPLLVSSSGMGGMVGAEFTIEGWTAISPPRFSLKGGTVKISQKHGNAFFCVAELRRPAMGDKILPVQIFEGEVLKLELPVIVKAASSENSIIYIKEQKVGLRPHQQL